MGNLLFHARYQIASNLMNWSLAILPSKRVRRDLDAILAAYRRGCSAAVLLAEMDRMQFFKGDAPSNLTVAGVTDALRHTASSETYHA